MVTRIVTGAVLTVVLTVALALGGWWFAVPFMFCICLSEYEIIRALKNAGHAIVEWPVWLFTVASLPMFTLRIGSTSVLIVFVVCTCMAICVVVIFRNKPQIEDIWASCMPIITAMLPGMCMLGFMRAENRADELFFIILSFGVPLLGDTMAYFIGTRFGKHKLCETVSPKKTREGAAAGLGGSVLFALALCGVYALLGLRLIPLWHVALLGLVGGFAGQLGDLLASLIKRHCNIKDYGSIFPGHGGITDRLDSVYLATVVVYSYMVLFY